MQGKHDDGSADADILGAPGNRSEEGPNAGEQAVAGEAVLAQPCLIQAGFVGELYLLQSIGEGLLLGKVLVIGDYGKDSELHGASCVGGLEGSWPNSLKAR